MNTYFKKLIEEIKPEKLYQNSLNTYIEQNKSDFNQFDNIFVLGIGKAASLEVNCILETFQAHLQLDIKEYLVVTKVGHTLDALSSRTIESTHPYLTEKSFSAANEIFDFLQPIGKKDLLICAISGGSSALIEKFAFDQQDYLVKKFNTVLDSGINIDELNTLRKAFSFIKNGEMVRNCKGEVRTFLTSDIPDNNPFMIGSSPSMNQSLDDIEVLDLLKKYQFEILPPEKENFQQRVFDKFEILIQYQNLIPICQKVFNCPTKINPIAYNCLLEEELEHYLHQIEIRYLNLSFGELNIDVKGTGLGGRNTHFVLKLAAKIFAENCLKLSESELSQLLIFSIGTDGTDGPTDAAGAWLTYEMYQRVDGRSYLENFDSYHYFEKVNGLIKTGPTGTNLMDIRGIGSLR